MTKHGDADSLRILHEMHEHSFAARTMSAQAARELGIRILREVYPSGSLVPDETELSKELYVSRTVVREAIKILTAKGLVEARPRLGTMVLPRRQWQILDREMLGWQQAMSYSPERLMQLMEMRGVIEPAAAKLAARRRTQTELERIRSAYDEMGDGVETPSEFVGADAKFHSAVLKACHNEYFDGLEALVFAGLLASIKITNPQASDNTSSLPLHLRVLEAIEAADEQAAEAAMTDLLRDAKSRLMNEFNRGKGSPP